MKNKSRWLALMLTGSMMISPLSYTRTYAAENEQQCETNLQETVEEEEADLDKKQDESQTEDAGNVKEDKRNDDLTKEDQKEESDKVDNSSDKSDNQNARVYKNGKLLKKYKNQSNVVEIKALMAKDWDKGFADYDYFRNVDMDEGICTPLRIALGDVGIGTLNIYLKYDKADDGLMISRVEVVDSKSEPGEED